MFIDDFDKTVEEVMQSDNLLWDGEHPSHEELEKVIREIVKEVTDYYKYYDEDEETWNIDEWDFWEHDIMFKVNEYLEQFE